MLRRTTGLLVLGFLLVSQGTTPARASDEGGKKPLAQAADTSALSLRASLLYDGFDARSSAQQVAPGSPRSVPLAFGLSAVVPGLGQAYNRQWVKAAIGVAAEAALIIGYTTWHGRGVDGRDAYQAYAHDFWSPIRYAYWLNDYKTWLETEFGTPVNASFIDVAPALGGINLDDPSGWTSAQRTALRDLFNQIREMESNVYHAETGASFSHKLPFFGEQQYYELIGKYFQFAPGWEDYEFRVVDGQPTWFDENGNALAAIDPEETGPNGSKPNVSNRFFDYAEDHGQANDYLRRASRLSLFFVVNHLVAAVDAAVFAKLHNNRLETSLSMHYDAFGDPQPVAKVRLTF